MKKQRGRFLLSSCYNLESAEHIYINFALAAYYPINSGALSYQYKYISHILTNLHIKKIKEPYHAENCCTKQSISIVPPMLI